MVKPKYELMAPAGNFPMLSAAVNAGADAVYFGLKDYSMRATSKNFTLDDLDEMREICNSSQRKVKIYLTLNTIVFDEEIEKLDEIIRQIKEKVDAIICWDHAIMMLCNKHKTPFFISTQASVANTKAAEYYKNLGAQRVVLARELNLDQIKKISSIIEVECFIHGAMCVAISGRCFMSQFTYNKSANRGECNQNCRRNYSVTDSSGHELRVENSRVLSAKDLCALPFIEKMKEAGVMSFKIEGRGRDPRYVDIVTSVYRKALDKSMSADEVQSEIKELEKVFNRQFSTGFYLGKPTNHDFSTTENSAATEVKRNLGKVTNYYSKNQVASIKLVADLAIGDKIVVIGNKTGIVTQIVSSMEIENKPFKKANKGTTVGVKILGIRKGDTVFKIESRV
ncbi:MAG: U32 family peptidase [candidate division Zixibacteria bacterium]|nr:U32 family peptidase [candidate division Zixibacteria bacterium]